MLKEKFRFLKRLLLLAYVFNVLELNIQNNFETFIHIQSEIT